MSMEKLIGKLQRQLKVGRLGHAYLIFGPLDEGPIMITLKVGEPDMFRLTEAPIKINHIRELRRWIHLKPHSSERKLAVIYQAESMTLESANAVLKILEEPPADSVLILQAFKKERILPTILSRCQMFKISSPVNKDLPEEYLAPDFIFQQSVKERFDYANKIYQLEKLPQILDEWEGYFRKKMLEGKAEINLLKKISQTRDLLLTNSSVKLLLENLLLDF